MKKHFHKIIGAALMVAAIQSCQFKDEINTDPINPSDAPMSALLPVAQVGVAYTVGGNIARYNGMFTQQVAGVDRQALSIGKGNIGQQDTDDPWDNMYKAMKNLQVIISKADAQKSPHYKGIAQIMMAYSLGITTDMWGDVPYTDAFKGTPDGNGFRPKYDKQEALYDTIQSLLDRGIANCQQVSSTFRPGSDDVIYNGNRSRWIAFAYAIKARHYLHLCKKFPSKYDLVIQYADSAETYAFSDAFVPFSGTSATNQSPMFQYNDQRGDIGIASALMDYFQTTADSNSPKKVDPRLFAYTDYSDTLVYKKKRDKKDTSKIITYFAPAGSFPGDANFGINFMGLIAYTESNPVYLLSRAELKFMQAEAQFAKGAAASVVETAFRDGVYESFNLAAPYMPEELNNKLLIDSVIVDPALTTPLDLEKIITQKWASLFLHSEPWNDLRRTGFPILKAPEEGNPLGDKIPRRYPYTQKERTLNSANIPDEGAQPALKRVWWDSE